MAKPALRMALSAVLALCAVRAGLSETVRVFGDRYWHPKATQEFVRTYVDMPKDHDGDTVPIAVGFQMTPGFIRAADELPVVWNYTANIPAGDDFPGGGDVPGATDDGWEDFPGTTFEKFHMNFPQVGRNPFPFAGFTYNFFGHAPVGLYDFQHFDVRFFMVDPDWWWNEQYPELDTPPPGIAACETEVTAAAFYRASLPVPKACWPGDPKVHQNVGHYMWGVGMHVYNLEEPGWKAFQDFTSINAVNSFTWGMNDGQIVYMESMFSRDIALTANVNDCVDLSDQIPEHFDTERWVPTRKCIVAGPATVKLEYSKFVKVPGGCTELRESAAPDALVGWFPPAMLATYKDGCKVSQPEGDITADDVVLGKEESPEPEPAPEDS